MRGVALGVLLASLAIPKASAQTFTWDGGLSHNDFTLNNNWSTGNNWVNGAPVSSANTAIVFTLSSQFTTATQNIASPFLLNSLTFDSTSNVSALFGSTLDFRSVPATLLPPTLTQNSSTNVIINNAILATAANLNVGGNGSGLLTLAGNIQSGNGFLFSKQGSMTLALNGTNSFASGFGIGQGVVRLNSSGALGNTGSILFTGGSGATGTLQYTTFNTTDYSSRFATTGGQPIRIDTNGQNITFASAISGAGTSLTKLGAGTLTLTGGSGNTFSGTTSVLAGTLVLSKSAANVPTAIGGDLSIGNPVNPGPASSVVVSLQSSFQTPSSSNLTLFQDGRFSLGSFNNVINNLTMNGGEVSIGFGTLSLGGNVTVNASSTGSKLLGTFGTNDVDLQDSVSTFSVAHSPGVVYDLDSTAGISKGILIKTGPGVLRLLGQTNFNLFVTLQSGTLALGNNFALGSFFGSLTTFTLAGGTVVADGGDRLISNRIDLTGNATLGASLDGTPHAMAFGAVTLVNSVTLTIANDAETGISTVDLASNTLSITGSGFLQISTVFGDGRIDKSGTGVLKLNGSNVFSGGLNVFGGSVLARNGALGSASNLIKLSEGTSIQFLDTNVTVDQTFELGLGTLVPAAGGSITYNAATVFGGSLAAGGHILGNNTRFDSVRLGNGVAGSQASGTVTLNNVLFTGTASFTQAAGATLNATGDFTMNPQTALTIAGTVNTQGGSLTGSVTVNNAGRLTTANAPLFLDGSIGIRVNAGGTLAATGTGTIELSGLLVNNGAHTGVLNINFGGLAKGAGTFGTVNVNDGGRFSPGNSPGTAVSGPMTWSAGGAYVWEINNATGTAGVNWDLAQINGTLTITANSTPGSRFTIEITSLTESNTPGLPANFDPNQPIQWPIATTAGVPGFDPAAFTLDTSHFAAPGTFAISEAGGFVILSFTPVPESNAVLPVALLGMAAIRRMRHGRRILHRG